MKIPALWPSVRGPAPICYECGKTEVPGVFVAPYENLDEAFICSDHHPPMGDGPNGYDFVYFSQGCVTGATDPASWTRTPKARQP